MLILSLIFVSCQEPCDLEETRTVELKFLTWDTTPYFKNDYYSEEGCKYYQDHYIHISHRLWGNNFLVDQYQPDIIFVNDVLRERIIDDYTGAEDYSMYDSVYPPIYGIVESDNNKSWPFLSKPYGILPYLDKNDSFALFFRGLLLETDNKYFSVTSTRLSGDFEFQCEAINYGRPGVIYAKIYNEAKRLTYAVYAVNLAPDLYDSPANGGNLFFDARYIRLLQLSELFCFIQKHYEPQVPAFIVGAFNIPVEENDFGQQSYTLIKMLSGSYPRDDLNNIYLTWQHFGNLNITYPRCNYNNYGYPHSDDWIYNITAKWFDNHPSEHPITNELTNTFNDQVLFYSKFPTASNFDQCGVDRYIIEPYISNLEVYTNLPIDMQNGFATPYPSITTVSMRVYKDTNAED